MMLKIVNTSPGILKQGIADAVSCYDEDFRAKRSDTDIDTVIDTDTETETVNTNFTRKRVLTMEKTINLLLSMQGGSLKKELYESGTDVTTSAFVQQRKKIPWIVFEDAFENFNRRCKDTKTYKGYRVLAVDGTCVNMARNPKAESFLERPSVDFLVRVKQDRSAMREIAKLPMMELDTDVSFTITTTQTRADKENGYILVQTRKNKDRVYSDKTRAGRWDFPSPYPMKFRVVRILLDIGEYETLSTSLPRSFTPAEIKELYHARWGIETAFRELKYGIGLVNLHGKSDDFVRQEVFTAMMMSNFCSRVTNEVMLKKKPTNIHEYQVNRTMAMDLCRKFFRTPDGDEAKLLRDIARYTEPVRPGRRDSRNIRAKSFAGFIYRVSA